MKKILLFILPVLLFSCSTDDLDPTVAQSKEVVIETESDLNAILIGMYNRFTSSTYYGRDVIVYGDCRTDNCYTNQNSGRFKSVGNLNMTANSGYALDTWDKIYDVIASANIIISTSLDDVEGDVSTMEHMQGQAYAARAIAYYDLTRLYGQRYTGGSLAVPYVTEYKGDPKPSRVSLTDMYSYIESDLNKAIEIMPSSVDFGDNYIGINAINAFKSRFFINTEQWEKAIVAAEAVINSGDYNVIPSGDYVSSFGSTSPKNAVFQLAFNESDYLGNTSLGEIYKGDSYADIEPLAVLYDLFESEDIRIDPSMFSWNDEHSRYYNYGKFPSDNGDQNLTIIRYEEVILNYAEALLETGSSDALTYLNMIPANRNATLYASVSKDNVLLERRKELAFEGFRFDDIMRTAGALPSHSDQRIYPEAGLPLNSYNFAFPIPSDEKNANSNIEQNAGY